MLFLTGSWGLVDEDFRFSLKCISVNVTKHETIYMKKGDRVVQICPLA